MNKRITSGVVISTLISAVWVPAYAVDGPKPVEIDGGPLGPLQFSAAADGYFYYQSGTSSNPGASIAGGKDVGAEFSAWMAQLKKSTGLIQFTLQLAQYKDINLGANKPTIINNNQLTDGPLRSAFISLVPTPDLKISVGQLSSLEGYESAFPWNNPSALRTVLVVGENASNRGVEVDYTYGPVRQFLATATTPGCGTICNT